MAKIILLCFLSLVAFAAGQRITTIHLDGVQYFISRMNPYSPELNYFLAYQYCRSLGLQLASFETKEKAESMTLYLKNAGYGNYDFWTSGNRLGTGMFLWMSTGLPFNATFDFFENSADAIQAGLLDPTDHNSNTSPQRTARDSSSGAEKGCVILKQPTLKWMPEDCSAVKDFICEQTRCYYYNYGSIPVSSAQGRPITSTTPRPASAATMPLMQLHSTTAQPPLMSTYLPYAKKMQQMAMEINQQQQQQQQQQQPTYNALKLDQERALDSDIEAEIEEHDDAVDTTLEDGEDDEEHNNFQDNDQNDSYDEHARELNDIKEHVLPNVPAEHDDDDDDENDNGIVKAVAGAAIDAIAANVAEQHSVAEHSNANDDDEEEDVASDGVQQHDDDVHADGETDDDSSLVAEAKIAADDENTSAGGSNANASDGDDAEDNIAPATIDSNEYAKTAIMHDNLKDLKTHNIVGNDLKTVDVKTQQQSEPAVEVRLKQISQEIANNNNNLKQLNNEQNIAATSPQHSGIISNLHHHTQLDSDDIGRQSFLSLTDLIRTLRPNDKQIIPQIDSDYSNAMRVLGEPANNGNNLKH